MYMTGLIFAIIGAVVTFAGVVGIGSAPVAHLPSLIAGGSLFTSGCILIGCSEIVRALKR